MHIHILGICGTFMGGIAALARAAGHRVSGCDRNVYPPMSTQLAALGIELHEGYDAEQLAVRPDLLLVGNVMTRGMPVIEAMLDRGLPYASGPEWLSREMLRERWVLAVAGTHGKTTTSSLIAWILQDCGREPGFLIGGVPANFGISARLGGAPLFVIEADEYDTAFFDKRAKFVHYHARTLVLNNLEYDHADIYPDLAAIERQFEHVLRTVPGSGRILCHAGDASLERVLAAGCWTPIERFGVTSGSGEPPLWSYSSEPGSDCSRFEVLQAGRAVGEVSWQLIGAHNAVNALAALAAAHHAGVPVEAAIRSLSRFKGVARRMQLAGEAAGVRVYDDFAHHPTAIATTLQGLRHRVGSARIIAVLEPRSATMRLGVHRETLGASLAGADEVWLYAPSDLGWDARAAVASLGARAHVAEQLEELLAGLLATVQHGDQVLIMSNGGFGGLHKRLLQALAQLPSLRATGEATRAGGA
ncbi:MAG TPA: UDP-N-acetylmuramate:L-alanyl-gamma-D-glutamyl-meso-diaminopimelate ligase [Steroidobacteraceae bacterium]|jgi:UDP-N-acetylmuramate: L-alanyl-gamma-D-glutamyl-meso-diaminopimelate ligase|nr:UDP-N-acetylmuramate:L-alanyl-gamma-D-glutamyl-meso-diaminopimelate ligase [Steroidobacteraceae bacterium]